MNPIDLFRRRTPATSRTLRALSEHRGKRDLIRAAGDEMNDTMGRPRCNWPGEE